MALVVRISRLAGSQVDQVVPATAGKEFWYMALQ